MANDKAIVFNQRTVPDAWKPSSDMTDDSDERIVLLNELGEEFAERRRRGERPELQEYIDRHPELADDIREYLPAMMALERLNVDRAEVADLSGFKSPALERLGDYRIIRQIGRGGMGIVYEAEQVSLGRRVALKVLPKQLLVDARTKHRFEREARAAARLHHTNIVPVFGVGEHDGLPYYVMQFIQGLGLDEVLKELRRFKPGASECGITPRASGSDLQATPDDDAATAPRTEITAAAMAHSLLTGRFEPVDDLEATEAGIPTNGNFEPAPAVMPPTARTLASGTLSDSFMLSSTSAVLPGAELSAGAGRKRSTYWQSVARIGVQVADALQYAHAQAVLHRDIKPSNLLLDSAGVVWVTDFGLAKADDQRDLTHTGDILGTLRYMPPEAFEGRADARGDVYSLGLTLYELLALRPAFDETDRNRLIKGVTTKEPDRLDWLNPEVPRDLVTIVHKAIERDPAQRYPSAGELMADLQRFLDDEPIRARRQSEWERFRRWARRNPAIAAVGGLLTAIMILATVVSLLVAGHMNKLRLNEARAADRERDARRDAETAAREAATAAREAEAAADLARRRGDAERWELYRSSIAAAAGASHEQNSGTAKIALDAAPPEHRNWEWQHFQSQLDGARLVLSIPGRGVAGLELSPSGRQIAVYSLDQNDVYLYDVATGRLDVVLRGHSGKIESVVYRPDGKQIATSDRNLTIRLWDLPTGRESVIFRVPAVPKRPEGRPVLAYSADGSRIVSFAHRDSPGTSVLWDAVAGKQIAVLGEWEGKIHRAAAFSPDGERVAVTSGGYVRLCDARTGRLIAALGPHEDRVSHLAYSSDGKRIASMSTEVASFAIHLWDGATGKEVAQLRGHTMAASILFNADGSRLLSGSIYPENTARLWDAAAGRLIAVLAGHKNLITSLAFSPDGTRAATTSRDHTARLWDGRTGQIVALLGGNTARIGSAVFSPNSARLVTASDDSTLRLWDVRTGELISVLRGHGGEITCTPVFTPDGSSLISGSADGSVRIWDVGLLERNGILRGHESFVYDVGFSPDGEQVASSAWDGTTRLWSATTGRQTGLLKHETAIVSSVAFSRDGRRLATVERERGAVLWDVASRTAVHTLPRLMAAWGGDTRATVDPSGKLLAMACVDGSAKLWDVESRKELAQLKGHQGYCVDVAFHPEGSTLATAGADGTVRLWDVATRAPRAVLRGHTADVQRVAYSGNGKLLASSSSDKTIRLWDAESGNTLATIPVGCVVYGLAFSPDGTRMAAGCIDNTVRLFDVTARQQVGELRGHTDFVHAVAWSPDGTRLVSGSGDYTVRIWDALPPAVRARTPDTYVRPRGYVAYRASSPLHLDGKLDDPPWQAVPWTDDFVDIEGDRRLPPRFRTRAKMLWDEQYFYIGVELEEPHIQATYTQHDSYIFHEDNDFEVFLNPDGNNLNYAELEMNALNTSWDLRLKKPYSAGGDGEDDWEIPGLKTAVHVLGTINNPRDVDQGWTIEIAIPWRIVGALNDKQQSDGPPRDGDQWRVNFSRVEWRFDIVAGRYVRRTDRREDNWVWSPQGVVNMHRPATWGYVQFSTAAPGQGTLRTDHAGPTKHLLERIYDAQVSFQNEHWRYASTLEELGLKDLTHERLAAPPRIDAGEDRFQATVDVKLPDGRRQRWSIREDSRVWQDR
jgi:eukaryotic-like serine/threonine-protein kinase